MSNLQEQIEQLLDPILTSLGLTLWDLDFKKEGPQWLLRIYIEHEPGGVTLGDCETVSRDLSTALDVEDLIPHAYTLEVSSPGIDRPLTRAKDYARFAGFEAKLETRAPIDGRKRFKGRLKGLEAETVKIEVEGAELALPLEEIEKAKLVLTDDLIAAHQAADEQQPN